MNCPKCGAKVAGVRPAITIFACGSEFDIYPPAFYEANQCLRNQLATVTAERDALKSDQNDWRKGVEFIASALGEKSPPDLSCVRLALLAAEVTAERDALLAACEEARAVMAINGSSIVDPSVAIRMADEAIEKARSV